MLSKLSYFDLKFVLMARGTKLLISMGANRLVDMLSKLGCFDLKFKFEIELDGKQMHEHIQDILRAFQASDGTRAELTKILQMCDLIDLFPKIIIAKKQRFRQITSYCGSG
jgi:hypothetical protein